MKIADFFAEIGFKVNLNSLRQFHDGMSGVVNTVKTLSLSLTGVVSAWEVLQTKIGRNAQTMLNFKRNTGESIEEVRKLATVMQSVDLNFSLDTLLNDIQSFKIQLREGQLFGEGSGLMQMMRVFGISGLKAGGMETIEDLLTMIRQLPDRATRLLALQKAGLSSQFMSVLDLPPGEFEKRAKQFANIFPSEEEMKRRQEAALKVHLIWMEIVNIFESKVTDFAPVLLDILSKIKEILSDSEKLKQIMDGIKWFAIAFGISMIGNAILGIVSGLWGIIRLAPLAVGALLALGGTALKGMGSFIYSNPMTQGLLNKMTAPAVKAGVGATARAAGKAGAKATGKAGAKAAAKTIAKGVGKRAAGRVAGAGAALLIPGIGELVGLGMLAWGAWDIYKLVRDLNRANGNNGAQMPSILSDEEQQRFAQLNETFNWNSNLASMTVNAQNVYLNASRVFTSDSVAGSEVNALGTIENNVARSTVDLSQW